MEIRKCTKEIICLRAVRLKYVALSQNKGARHLTWGEIQYSNPPTLIDSKKATWPETIVVALQLFCFPMQSFIALGGLFGGPLAWLVLDRLGRKPALMFGGIFTFVGWLLIALTQFVSGSRAGFLAMFLVGRLLTGLGAGWASLSVSVREWQFNYSALQLLTVFATVNCSPFQCSVVLYGHMQCTELVHFPTASTQFMQCHAGWFGTSFGCVWCESFFFLF